jgi:predicted nucleotidyltransferase
LFRIGYNSTVIDAGQLEVDEHKLRAIYEKWRIAELALFGSVLRDDFGADSDVDLLVTFEQGEQWRLADLSAIQEELRQLFGRHVDLVERRAVEQNPNWVVRRDILESAQRLRVA